MAYSIVTFNRERFHDPPWPVIRPEGYVAGVLSDRIFLSMCSRGVPGGGRIVAMASEAMGRERLDPGGGIGRIIGRRAWKRMNLAIPFSLSKPLVKTEKAPTNPVYAECQTLSGELLLMFRRKRFGYHYIRQHWFKARRIIRIIHSANAIANLNRLTSGNRMN